MVKALSVVTEPAVEGRWHWMDNQNLQYRPEKYWATGTKITVTANLLGVDLRQGRLRRGEHRPSISPSVSRRWPSPTTPPTT